MVGKNGVPLSRSVHLGLGSYVHCDTLGHTFGLEIVHPLRGFLGEPYLLYTICLFSDS
jgi:hypothetical protein